MNFDSPSHNDNVSSALIRRSVALAAMGSQRADLSLRRASRLALRRQQFEEVRRLLQEAVVGEREREREQVAAVTVNQSQPEQNVNMVISENQNPVEENDDDGANPWGIQF
jgi:hypothetical protein